MTIRAVVWWVWRIYAKSRHNLRLIVPLHLPSDARSSNKFQADPSRGKLLICHTWWFILERKPDTRAAPLTSISKLPSEGCYLPAVVFRRLRNQMKGQRTGNGSGKTVILRSCPHYQASSRLGSYRNCQWFPNSMQVKCLFFLRIGKSTHQYFRQWFDQDI